MDRKMRYFVLVIFFIGCLVGCTEKEKSTEPQILEPIITGVTPGSGIAGTEVTIQIAGEYLSDAEIINNSQHITILSVESESELVTVFLSISSDAEPSIINFQLRTPEGSTTFSFEILPDLSPVVTSFRPEKLYTGYTLNCLISGIRLHEAELIFTDPSIEISNVVSTNTTLHADISCGSDLEAGTYDFQLITENGNTDYSVEILELAAPEITDVTPGYTHICQETVFTINGSGLVNPEIFSNYAGLDIEVINLLYGEEVQLRINSLPTLYPGTCVLSLETPAGVIDFYIGFQTHEIDRISWNEGSPIPIPSVSSSAVWDNENQKFIITGGRVATFRPILSSVLSYDPLLDMWEELNELPFQINHHSSTIQNGLLFITGGIDSIYLEARTDFLAYDLSTQETTILPDLPTPRGYHFLVSDESFLYQFDGLHQPDIESYDSVNESWQPINNELPDDDARAYHAYELVGRRLFVAGGCNLLMMYDNRYSNEFYYYHLDQNQWFQLANMPYACAKSTLNYYAGNLILIGGQYENPNNGTRTYYRRVEAYNISEGYWYSLEDLPIERIEHKTCVFNNKLYVTSGANYLDIFTPILDDDTYIGTIILE